MKLAFFDTETTGLDTQTTKIIEFAMIICDEEQNIDISFSSIIDPGVEIQNSHIHGITTEMARQGRKWPEFGPKLLQFLEDQEIDALAGHNIVEFDIPVMRSNCARIGKTFPTFPTIDTLYLARRYLSDNGKFSLTAIRERYSIETEQAHRALDDTKANIEMFFKMISEAGLSVHDVLRDQPKHLGFVGKDPIDGLFGGFLR